MNISLLTSLSFTALSLAALNGCAIQTALPDDADACKAGYVWRASVAADRVCVTVQRRDAVALENTLADSRRSPTGGAYGPNTCLNGFVWREASSTDLVCVPPDSRAMVKAENADAANRYVVPHTPPTF
jgi:hypothetical protein